MHGAKDFVHDPDLCAGSDCQQLLKSSVPVYQYTRDLRNLINHKKEMMNLASHQQCSQLLHNKFVLVLGDSIQRSVYKDLVLLLQSEKYLTWNQLKSKGEMNFEQDCLVEGGCLNQMHNGTEYREVRQFQSAHHLVRFYFVTRIYNGYMQSILKDIRHGMKPDVVIVNSCIWDISRYKCNWISDYKENLNRFFEELVAILPKETLVIWSLTMPLAKRIRGGFLIPEIEHKASQLRYDVIEANFYSATLADAYSMDVLDFHFQFRFSLHHRTKDGVHWNALAHRKITSLLLQHAAQAWGVIMPCPLTVAENIEVTDQQPANGNVIRPAKGNYDRHRRAPPSKIHAPVHRHARNGFNYSPHYHFEPYYEHRHQHVMRSRHTRHHYVPYTCRRHGQHTSH
uniref:PC-esterase domain-containing protein 1A isoform X2 n=1 Tax=Monopterus albus TaxID=43700 RepID=UPI0009B4AEA4|nr:PC-esterase domain-containing protein 1A-like isoform X2 [Monopterus albus]